MLAEPIPSEELSMADRVLRKLPIRLLLAFDRATWESLSVETQAAAIADRVEYLVTFDLLGTEEREVMNDAYHPPASAWDHAKAALKARFPRLFRRLRVRVLQWPKTVTHLTLVRPERTD